MRVEVVMNYHKIAAVAIFSVPLQVAADQQGHDFCTMYHQLQLLSSKVECLEVIGKPYNEKFHIQSYDDQDKYRFTLNKDKFIELYLTFSQDGKLHNKSIAGVYCPRSS